MDIVEFPRIDEVFIEGGNGTVRASTFLNKDRRDYSILRQEFDDAILRGDPIARCAACHKPVKPRLSIHRRRYFRHHGGDGNCPYKTSGKKNQTQIDAMRYNGQKEGPEHIHIKQLLKSSLSADSSFDQDSIAEEQRWWGVTDPAKWRKPDISAQYGDLPIAFEVQLSTTFLNVVVERRRFYLENGGLLIWVFKRCEKEIPRQFQDDIFYNNNSNLFVVDEETCRLSQENQKLMLRCYYLQPMLNGGVIQEAWREQIVCFSELSIDRENQRIFFYDCMEELNRLEEFQVANRIENLRRKYLEFWETYRYTGYRGEEASREYSALHRALKEVDIDLPQNPKQDIARFSCLVLSAKDGKSVGFDYQSLLEVANFAYDHCRPLLWYFCTALKGCGKMPVLMEEDRHAAERKRRKFKGHTSWDEKLNIIREGIREWNSTKTGDFPQERNFDQLFGFLLPEQIGFVQKKP